MLSGSLKSRPITPTPYDKDFRKYSNEYMIPRKGSARRKVRKNENKMKGMKNELVIEPWEIRE